MRRLGEAEAVKSVGNSATPPRDLLSEQDVRRMVTVLAESVAERLRAQGLCGSVVSLSVRDSTLSTFQRQRRLAQPTALAAEIIPNAMALFRESYRWERPVRSLGISLSALSPLGGDEQLSMFPDAARDRRYELEGAVEEIRHRFGHDAILRASLIRDGIGAINPRDDHLATLGGRAAGGEAPTAFAAT